MTPRTPAQRLPRPHPTTWRDRQPAIYAGLFAGVLIAAGIAWHSGTLQYFIP